MVHRFLTVSVTLGAMGNCLSVQVSHFQSIHPSAIVVLNKCHISSGNSCDQTSMYEIPYGEALSLLDGALYRSNPLLITKPLYHHNHDFDQYA